ncbi:hypothetical protein ACFC1T_34030 [Kitasatospora sp. NPDC056076]|uniref:hypothetical protein n=1 Tax=Kitasatospora sp. NPDC056076 TaxID=3345703 RepID=UPI0035DCC0A1
MANPDFVQAERGFAADTKSFSPVITMRCWINPASEPDVTFVQGVPVGEDPTDPEE